MAAGQKADPFKKKIHPHPTGRDHQTGHPIGGVSQIVPGLRFRSGYALLPSQARQDPLILIVARQMGATQQFSFTLPNQMSAQLRAKVASGEYATESEVIRDGLRTLQARDKAVEHWLRNDVVNSYEALKADPSRGHSLADTREALAKRHAARLAKTATA